jgi:hypothetical protein
LLLMPSTRRRDCTTSSGFTGECSPRPSRTCGSMCDPSSGTLKRTRLKHVRSGTGLSASKRQWGNGLKATSHGPWRWNVFASSSRRPANQGNISPRNGMARGARTAGSGQEERFAPTRSADSYTRAPFARGRPATYSLHVRRRPAPYGRRPPPDWRR